MPSIIAPFWYLILLILYYRSNDEPFWLVFFLTTTDGFMGFLGLYAVSFQVIPGLPAIELAQFYIVLLTIKAIRIRKRSFVFYNKFLIILLFYVVFLIVWGQLMGFSQDLKGYFRILKLTAPLLLFYSIPRVLNNIGSYNRLFSFIFLVSIAAFFTQLFTLLSGFSPAGTLELTEEQISEAGTYRGFYNVSVTLLGLLGSLFYLSIKKGTIFSPIYLLFVVFSVFGIALLSATRGYIIGFGLIIFLSLLATYSIRTKWKLLAVVIASVLVFIGSYVSKINEQVQFALDRIVTLETLTTGDITAKGTLIRLEVRGPRVMGKFRENPVFGWGISDTSRKYGDGHVGNQNLLMTSGIFGFSLLLGFFANFCFKLFVAHIQASSYFPYKNGFLIIIVFFLGWFFIHSTSGQHFNYFGIPDQIIPQAVFFSFGALVNNMSKEEKWFINRQPTKVKQ